MRACLPLSAQRLHRGLRPWAQPRPGYCPSRHQTRAWTCTWGSPDSTKVCTEPSHGAGYVGFLARRRNQNDLLPPHTLVGYPDARQSLKSLHPPLPRLPRRHKLAAARTSGPRPECVQPAHAKGIELLISNSSVRGQHSSAMLGEPPGWLIGR